MKRTILFRGKAKTITPTYEPEGTWVYGFYNEIDDMSVIERKQDFCQVEKDSVGQYTGLMDRNGKRVFEGDIVIIEYSNTKVKGYIEYQGVAFYVATNSDLWDINEFVSIEVIGNIHDNPELLEV